MTENLPQEAGEKSLWLESPVAALDNGPLQQEIQAEVLIVGAGFTGLSSALHLAEQGVSVVLLEAACVGFGGSGRNAGLVNAGIWKNPDHVSRILGPEAAARMNLALRDSPQLVFGLVDRYNMQCDAQRCGTIHMAHSKSGLGYLEERFRQLSELGRGVEMLDGDRSQLLSGSPGYAHGGILDANAGTIQPLAYARELARAAIGKGLSLYQQSALTGLERKGEYWQATTASGRVTARQVIMATNAYSDIKTTGANESTVPVYIFQCATAPLDDDQLAATIPERHGLWDTDVLLTSSRIDAKGRLVMSFPGGLQGGQRSLRQDFAMRRRNRLFPQLRGLPWEYFWTGRIGVTNDKILHVQMPGPGLFAPAGYNGRGIGTGTVMGKQLAQAIVNGNHDDFPFPVETLHRENWRGVRAAYYDYGTLALQLCSNRG